MKCRHCQAELTLPLVDLGSSPPSNAYLTKEILHAPEKYFPLRVLVCTECWLVQTEDIVDFDEMFTKEYAYFSSFSETWLEHARNYVEKMVTRFNLSSQSQVVEVAANDGYLLQYVKLKSIPCYGVEPTHSTAMAARERGIDIVEEFFGEQSALLLKKQRGQADLIIANNVLAHVPDINDFVRGFVRLLKPEGFATFEFPHLLNLVQFNQFDTIYHEHFSYLSFTAIRVIFEANGLRVFDVEQLPTHGGSLRIYAQRSEAVRHKVNERVFELQKKEDLVGMNTIGFYKGFQDKPDKIKMVFMKFLIEAKQQGKSVAAYGAAAKGNTLMNYAGIGPDLISYVVDKNPAKQGSYMPGNRLRIVGEIHIKENQPDYVVIFPWNIRAEVIEQLAYIREWGGQFVVAIPELELL
jgi:SAM-dependent methyltransferase